MMDKFCGRCKLTKPRTEFHVRIGRRSGIQAQCKSCHKEWHAEYVSTIQGRATMLRNAARSRCKISGLTLDLPLQWVIDQLTLGKCCLTGIEFDYKPLGDGSVNPFSPSIDRVDSSLGYTVSNCRIIVASMNLALNAFGEPIFERLAIAYLNARNQLA